MFSLLNIDNLRENRDSFILFKNNSKDLFSYLLIKEIPLVFLSLLHKTSREGSGGEKGREEREVGRKISRGEMGGTMRW